MTYSVICKSNPNLNLGSILIWGRSKNLLVEQNFLKNLIRIPKILVCPVWENVVLTSSGRLSNGAAYLLGATFEIPYFILTEEVATVIPRLSFQSSNGIPNHLSLSPLPYFRFTSSFLSASSRHVLKISPVAAGDTGSWNCHTQGTHSRQLL